MAHVRLQPGEMWRAQSITITRDVDGELLTLERDGCIFVIAASELAPLEDLAALFARLKQQRQREGRYGRENVGRHGHFWQVA